MILRFILVLLALAASASLAAQCRFDRLDQGRVVKLSGADLPASLLGVPLTSLSLMRVENGGFVPVAFQFDELDSHGMVWFEGSGFEQVGEAGVLDPSDQLLAMLTDAGPRAPITLKPDQGQLLADLEVAQQCHLYLVSGNPLRSDNYYVAHDIDSGETRTALYQLDVEPDNELNWLYLGYNGYQGQGSIIDTLKMRMSAGLLSRFTRMTLDNHNLRPRMVGHKLGQIRSIMHLRTKVVLAGIPVMTLQVQAMRYAAHYEAHTYAKIPDLYRATLKEPEVSVTVDGNNQLGARVYTSAYADNPAIVDGKPGDDGDFAGQPLSMADNWVLFDSQKKFVLLTELTVPESLLQTPLRLVYQDDGQLKVEPEQFVGQLPNLGYALQGWPEPEELRFTVSLYFDQGLRDLPAADFARQRSAAVPFQISAQK